MFMHYIYCHPLFDERKCAHRFSFQLKNTFEAAGLTLERFDYRGTGEAEGQFADVSLETLREDIAKQTSGEQVCLIGLRFGASLAFDYCVHGSGQVSSLVLLEPVIDGARYVEYLYRRQHIKDLMTGKVSAEQGDRGYANLEGYKTSIRFTEQIKEVSLIEMARRYRMRNSVYIVQISNGLKISSEITSLAKLVECSARQVVVENIELPMFWERIPDTDCTKLTEKVLRWCCG